MLHIQCRPKHQSTHSPGMNLLTFTHIETNGIQEPICNHLWFATEVLLGLPLNKELQHFFLASLPSIPFCSISSTLHPCSGHYHHFVPRWRLWFHNWSTAFGFPKPSHTTARKLLWSWNASKLKKNSKGSMLHLARHQQLYMREEKPLLIIFLD